jgi:hypothetical protein
LSHLAVNPAFASMFGLVGESNLRQSSNSLVRSDRWQSQDAQTDCAALGQPHRATSGRHVAQPGSGIDDDGFAIAGIEESINGRYGRRWRWCRIYPDGEVVVLDLLQW